jgi:hypothetical protein
MFDEKICQKLKYYVYLLVDPKTNEPFYVGKGINNRVFNHVECTLNKSNETNSLKYSIIQDIINRGDKVKHIIVRHGLTEKTAFALESALIDTFKFIPKFSSFVQGNIQGGVNSIENGLMSTNQIIGKYNAETLTKIADDCLIININSSYIRGAGENAIYDATKCTWKIKKSRLPDIKFVLSEYKGLIVEVFKVDSWYEKERGFTKGSKRYGETYMGSGFHGEVAISEIRDLYINKSIAKIKKRGFSGAIIFPKTLQKFQKN